MLKHDYTPKDFYVYVHRKVTTGQPFYVGKGSNDRAWFVANRSAWWKRVVARHGVLVEIHTDGLQEWAAFELERDLITLHGRIQDNTGPLINGTDGGEGFSGVTEAQRVKLRELARRNFTPERRAIGVTKMTVTRRTTTSREKARIAQKQAWADPTKRYNMLAAIDKRTADPMWQANVAAANKRTTANPVWLTKQREAMAKLWNDPVFREKNAASLRKAVATPEWREANLTTLKKTMSTDEWKASHSAGVAKRTASKEWQDANRASVRAACGVSVICTTTGQVFETVSDAAKWLRDQGHEKAKGGAVSRALKYGSTPYGYAWAYYPPSNILDNK
jgi:hypothetical protein